VGGIGLQNVDLMAGSVYQTAVTVETLSFLWATKFFWLLAAWRGCDMILNDNNVSMNVVKCLGEMLPTPFFY
jgi:hypothetical protein